MDSQEAAALRYITATQGTDSVTIEMRKRYPQYAVYLDHPEIGPKLKEAFDKGWGTIELEEAIKATRWYKTTSATARQWELQKQNDPATAERQLYGRRMEISNLAHSAGLRLSIAQLRAMAENSIKLGWTDAEIKATIALEYRKSGSRRTYGDIRASADAIRDKARGEYLFDISKGDSTEFAIRIFDGSWSEAGVDSWFRDQTKGRFPWMKEQLDQGITPGVFFRPMQERVAEILETTPDAITLYKGKYSELIDYVNPGGDHRSMNIREAEEWARQQDEYNYTTEARDRTAGLVDSLSKTMGVRS